MKNIIPYLLVVLVFSCTGKKKQQITDVDPFPVKYENELFAISLPEGWIVDDSGWQGLDSMNNEVDFYNPHNDAVFFHFVKTFFPFQWKNSPDPAGPAPSRWGARRHGHKRPPTLD